MKPILYSFRRCPYAMRARIAIYASNQTVELREIVLRDKAPELLAASPKGTVPVLVTQDDIIDESYDIMMWALKRNDPDGLLMRHDPKLIAECDTTFKSALDRYKYANRFENVNASEQRQIASDFINKLEKILEESPYLGGKHIGFTDYAIVTFVRQFANVDRDWFDSEPWPYVINWLDNFLQSDIFANIMYKYTKWEKGDAAILFPECPK